MATTVSMPQLGETVTEGTILKWAKQVGDTITEEEVLVEISTDKVDTEVPSPVGGTILELLVEEGDTVEVGVELVVIGEAGEIADSSLAPESAESTPDDLHPASETPAGPDTGFEASLAADPATAAPTEDKVEAFFAEPSAAEADPQLLSPVVRRLVRENNIDVSAVQGSGQGGRVTRKDVEEFIALPTSAAPAEAVSASPSEAAAPPESEAAAPPESEAAAPPESEAVASATVEPVSSPSSKASLGEVARSAGGGPEGVAAEESETVELDRLRIRIAENNLQAKATAAHVWTSVEVDYERIERVRQAHKVQFKSDEGFSLTYLPFIARATIDALKAYPVVNSSFNLEEKTATFHKNVDLGIAIDLNQKGLMVARIRNADGLRLVGIARDIRALAVRGRDGKLGVDDVTGSTFTLTNPGPFGSFISNPIINVPNVAILSTDTVTKRPTVVTADDGQDMIAIRHIGYLGLTWDHRAFDGSTAVLFLRRIKDNLETWDWEQELA